jgi:NAD(P)-dependent dehydrogenase (short-subunit alcohol dehydrogenase family)
VAQELAGKVAIITGGAGGIGRATARLFVEEGGKVVLADLDEERGEEEAAKLGDSAVFHKADVSQEADIEALIDRAVSVFGGLHIMFNNAGIVGGMKPRSTRLIDADLSDFHKIMGVNVLGAMLGSQYAARQMVKQGAGGSIINTASIAGVTPGLGFTVYRASKAALINFTKSAAIDFAEYGIRANVIIPGHIRTPISSYREPGMSQELADRLEATMEPIWLANQPLKQRGQPIDIANAALFLGSDRSGYSTGGIITVDGGISAGDPVNHIQEMIDARARVMGS